TLDLIERIGPNKIIFGTDYPMPYAGRVHRMKDFVDCIRDLNLPNNIIKGIFKENLGAFLTGDKAGEKEISAVEMMEEAVKLKTR
ncbi:MAG: hypothetical protein U9R21_02040, partial [Candidatus Thermoplasmatota archaeon]|nr:hypothetical protein [Candidatus Thermoplasmatota archaeon]